VLTRPAAWPPSAVTGNPDLWLWAGAIVSALVAGGAQIGHAGAALLVVFVIFDGEVNYLEGAMLTGLYVVLGSLFWWS
jgi:hypothetical protein